MSTNDQTLDAKDRMRLAVNHLTSDLAAARIRQNLALKHGGLDSKRPRAWAEFGFTENLEFSNFYGLYRRQGVAYGVVENLLARCWKSDPWLILGDKYDDTTPDKPWEVTAKTELGRKFWHAFKEADRRRLVARWSALVLHIGDDRRWSEPVLPGQARELKKMTPVWQSALTPASYDEDPQSERYGEVVTWNYRPQAVNGKALGEVLIHRDRLFILGDPGPDGIGFLEPGFNAFVSLEKVEGGSGEGFLKNAARQLSVNFDKDVHFDRVAKYYGVELPGLREEFDKSARDMNQGLDNMWVTQGATTDLLVADIPDPTPTYNINLQTAAASVMIPSKIVVGNQTGERASSEDEISMNARCQSRRNTDLTPEMQELIDRLIEMGCISRPPEDFTVMWDDLSVPTKTQRLTNAKTMSEINAASIATGSPVFSSREIRTEAGYDPEPAEGDPLGDDDPAGGPVGGA